MLLPPSFLTQTFKLFAVTAAKDTDSLPSISTTGL